MPRRAARFAVAYAAWLIAVAASGLLNLTGHTLLAFLPALAVMLATGLGASSATQRRQDRFTPEFPPFLRRPAVLVAVLGGFAFAVAGGAGDVYLGVVGRDAAGVVTRTGCAQVGEHGGGCAPICEVAPADGGRPLGWMSCEGSGGQVGDRTTVRVDPGGFAVAMQAADAYSRPVAKVLGWAALAVAVLAGGLLFNAVCLGPARDIRIRAARTRATLERQAEERQVEERG